MVLKIWSQIPNDNSEAQSFTSYKIYLKTKIQSNSYV